MSNIGEIIQAISIGLIAACFLLNTNRVLKTIELCRECLVILKDKAGIKEDKLAQLFYKKIYMIMSNAYSVGNDNTNAIKFAGKTLQICRESGERSQECKLSLQLARMYIRLDKFLDAKELLEKALRISTEIGDKNGKAICYGNLGTVFESVGEYDKAREYLEKSLAIRIEIGDRNGEACCYRNLGTVFRSFGEYGRAREYLEKSLAITTDVGDRNGEAYCCGNLGTVYQSFGEYEKATKYLEKALAISKEIGDRNGEAGFFLDLGAVLSSHGEYDRAEEYLKKALEISEDIRHVHKQFQSLHALAHIRIQEKKIQEAISYFLAGIEKCEAVRGTLRDDDQLKMSFSDKNSCAYRELSTLLCETGNPNAALYVSELGKARALADLMAARYSLENQISANPQTWAGIESVMDKERNCSCLYLSYCPNSIYFWILKGSGTMQFRKIKVNEVITDEDLSQNLDDYLASVNFGGPDQLSLCYNLIIAPVADLLDGAEIIIIPDRSLYKIPFAALPDESGKAISESFKIRVVPSLTTLRLIYDSPADYHSQTGALIVGNPEVGRVRFNGRLKYISGLPCAEEEAKMVGKMVGIEPLLGEQATKQAVLQAISSVGLIHFAVPSDAERGEIFLAPTFSPNRRPREEDYLLTMSDISQVHIRAKLVVLSCSHSARGQIKAEGVVGIARAFLGSGARSVLVALWALQDRATEQLMSHFYDHLVCGESASESLHQAMKWMRCNGYSDVEQWAPFILIGDNVTFNFGK